MYRGAARTSRVEAADPFAVGVTLPQCKMQHLAIAREGDIVADTARADGAGGLHQRSCGVFTARCGAINPSLPPRPPTCHGAAARTLHVSRPKVLRYGRPAQFAQGGERVAAAGV